MLKVAVAVVSAAVVAATVFCRGVYGYVAGACGPLSYSDISFLAVSTYLLCDRAYDREACLGGALPAPFAGAFSEYPPLASALLYISAALARYPVPALIPVELWPLAHSAALAASAAAAYAVALHLFARGRWALALAASAMVAEAAAAATTGAERLVLVPVASSAVSLAYVHTYMLSRASGRLAAVACLSPSLLLYAIYNFDTIAVALVLAGLSAVERGRTRTGLVVAGLGASVKLVPLGILGSVVLGLWGLRRGLPAVLLLASPTIAQYALVAAVAPRGLWDSFSYLSTWFCEGCVFLLVTGSPYDPLARAASQASLLLLGVYLVASARRLGGIGEAYSAGWAAAHPVLYASTPQMAVLYLPLAYTSLPGLLPLFLAADLANAPIAPMVVWEHSVYPNRGFELGSYSQAFAQARNLILLAAFALTQLAAWRGRRPGRH